MRRLYEFNTELGYFAAWSSNTTNAQNRIARRFAFPANWKETIHWQLIRIR